MVDAAFDFLEGRVVPSAQVRERAADIEMIVQTVAVITLLMQRYYVPINRLRTHQEWTPTICPGRHIQSQMIRMRASSSLA